ncbi:DUF3027 domain-containing protein [Agromyces mediolanus]|uniref:DUF3027 domain-containing protein n=1 Tax=Agromyces mediolanus TaxID=41986 RepID=UPI0038341DB1
MPEPRESEEAPVERDEQPAAESAAAEPTPLESADDGAAVPGSDDAAEPSAPLVADEVLLASAALAQRALLEATPPETVGSVVGHIVEGEHVLTLLFAADLAGYPGWHWSVTIARVEDAEPTVLETELMPGERALLAPEWVPWSERLAEYRAAQNAAAEAAALAGDDPDGDGSDDERDDESDDFDDESDDDESDDDGFDDHDDHDDVFDGIEIDALGEEPDATGAQDEEDSDDDDSDDEDDDRD